MEPRITTNYAPAPIVPYCQKSMESMYLLCKTHHNRFGLDFIFDNSQHLKAIKDDIFAHHSTHPNVYTSMVSSWTVIQHHNKHAFDIDHFNTLDHHDRMSYMHKCNLDGVNDDYAESGVLQVRMTWVKPE
jgi:hypothetical protein